MQTDANIDNRILAEKIDSLRVSIDTMFREFDERLKQTPTIDKLNQVDQKVNMNYTNFTDRIQKMEKNLTWVILVVLGTIITAILNTVLVN